MRSSARKATRHVERTIYVRANQWKVYPALMRLVHRRFLIGHVYSVLLTALRSFTISSNRYQTSLPL
jgi:hypothetical protein